LIMNGNKMAKSTGNYILPGEIFTGENANITKAFSPGVARFFMLQAHYRSILDFTNDGLLASEKGFNRLMDALSTVENLKISSTTDIDIESWKNSCYNAMNDDFNTPVLIANLFEGVKYINQIKDGKANITNQDLKILKETMHNFIFDILGLETSTQSNSETDKLSGTVDVLIKLRQEARANKDFALSDKIRDELASLGIELKDGKEGTTFSVN